MDGTARNHVTQAIFDYYVRLALEARGDKLTPEYADEIRRIARSALNYKFKLAPFEEDRRAYARRILEIQGRRLFGEPSPENQLALEKIEDLARLDRMTLRILEASSWSELLETQ